MGRAIYRISKTSPLARHQIDPSNEKGKNKQTERSPGRAANLVGLVFQKPHQSFQKQRPEPVDGVNRTPCLPDSPVLAELISSLRIICIHVPTELEHSQRPSQSSDRLQKRQKCSGSAGAGGRHTAALFKAPLWLMGCLAPNEIFHGYTVTRSGPFFSHHSWTIDGEEAFQLPRGLEGRESEEGESSSNRLFLLILSELKPINCLGKAHPEVKGNRRKPGSGQGQEERGRRL